MAGFCVRIGGKVTLPTAGGQVSGQVRTAFACADGKARARAGQPGQHVQKLGPDAGIQGVQRISDAAAPQALGHIGKRPPELVAAARERSLVRPADVVGRVRGQRQGRQNAVLVQQNNGLGIALAFFQRTGERHQPEVDAVSVRELHQITITARKICGLSRPCDIEWVNDAGVDFAGFVFTRSRRQVSPEQAKQLHSMLKKEIPAVGVFVNETIETIVGLVEDGVIDWVQLHGQEDEAYINELKSKVRCPVIQAFSIRTKEDVLRARESYADYILLDQGSGGTGRVFDWTLIESIGRPFFLAGGLNAENIKEAVRTGAWAFDVSSGAETDGFKDREKIFACVAAARQKEEYN